ncbi:MAG: hypothetical protein AB8H79_16485 [Myxococcota bacterium]
MSEHPLAIALRDLNTDDNVDHAQIEAVMHQVTAQAPSMSREELAHVQHALATLIDDLNGLKERVKTQLGGVATKNRAARGYGKGMGQERFHRGQRVNRGV